MVYYFHTRLGQHKLLSNASQVGVPALARPSTTFQKIDIEIPDISSQKQIVAILQAIHDKITLNTAINENLRCQAA
jgi:type I restriction enzyme S subunit